MVRKATEISYRNGMALSGIVAKQKNKTTIEPDSRESFRKTVSTPNPLVNTWVVYLSKYILRYNNVYIPKSIYL